MHLQKPVTIKLKLLFSVVLAVIISSLLLLVPSQTVSAIGGQQRVAYYGNWDIYGNDYTLKKVHESGAASQLTTLVYSFENIHPTNLTCFQDIHPVDISEENASGGDGGADAWGDYQYAFPAHRSVDGQADSDTQPLRGNFNQLKKLKALHPNLNIMVSIGGWTFSKYFSPAAATAASRQAFVSSCIDMYITGNLPTGIAGDTTAGGQGVAAGIFDGIDIDWEFPGSNNGHLGNIISSNDEANFTALLAEFRTQLNAKGLNSHGRPYRLTAALPTSNNDMNQIQVSQIAQYLDYAGIMSYDMHGGWEPTTNFQAPLLPAPNDPGNAQGLNIQQTVQRWTAAGMPASKILVGVPFYWRGWSGVTAGSNYGLYSSTTGKSPAYPFSANPGVAHYKELLTAGKLIANKLHVDPASGNSPWIFDNNEFYTGDTPASISQKGNYIRSNNLGGAMIYSLESDDPSGTMLKSVITGLNGGTITQAVSSITIAKAARVAQSSANTATNAEPINMIGGNFLLNRHEFSVPGKEIAVDFALNYNSALATETGPNGWGWSHSYHASVFTDLDGSVVVQNPDNRMDRYTPSGSGGFTAPSGIFDTLTFANGVFTVTKKDRSQYTFNTEGLLSVITTVNGNTQTLHYDSDNKLTSLTDSANRTFTFTYHPYTGLIATVTDPANRVVSYAYDALGQLTQVTNQANEVTKYTYDGNHQLFTITDPRGNTVVTNEYDSEGRVTKQTNGRGKVVTLAYEPGKTTFTDANGGQTMYWYDAQLRLTKVQDALGGITTTSYSTNGNPSQVTDALNHTTSYNYDARGNLLQVTDPANQTLQFAYDTQDNIVTVTDQLGRITTYTYDAKGNITQRKDPLNNITTFAYNAAGQTISITDALNNLTGFVYNANGDVVTATDPSNRNTYYGYDNVGRLVAVQKHNLEETEITLDGMDRVTKVTDPSVHDTLVAYDADGNKTSFTDANNHSTAYEYDANNNLTKATNALGKATLYEYDGNNNLIKKTDAKGRITTYSYDLLNRQTQTTDPLGKISKITYDAAGNVASRIDASNRTTTYAYDALGRLTTTSYPDATTITNTYDAVNNLLTTTNANGTTTYTYDANNRMLTSKDPHNAVVTYTYNAIGSLIQIKYPDNKTVNYTYTPSNQLSTVTDWNNQTTSYLYDNNARVAVKNFPNTLKATYAYDVNGNLGTLTYKKGAASFTKYAYTRDNVGNVIEEDETKANGSHAYNDYTYDAANQLTMADAPTDTYTYTYDDVGNMATSVNGSGVSTYTYNNGNQLTAKNGVGARTFTYDNQGNQITDGGKSLAYDFDNQLKSFASGTSTTSYIYDATGNRIDKKLNGTGTFQYVNVGNNNALVTKNLSNGTSNFSVFGLDLVSQGDAANATRQYFVADGMGNTRYLTSNTGATVATYAYDPYGKQISGSTTASNYTYQAELKDPESALTFLRARYYDATTGRFTSQDPLSGSLTNPASQNGYNYANNNPINLSDPSGMAANYGYNPSLGRSLLDWAGISKIQADVQNCDWGSLAKDSFKTGMFIDGQTGGVLLIGLGGTGKVAGAAEDAAGFAAAARKLSKAEQLAANIKQGAAAEKSFFSELESIYGLGNVKSQIVRNTSLGRRVVDFEILADGDPTKVVLRYEVKSGKAFYGGRQKAKDLILAAKDGIETTLIRK